MASAFSRTSISLPDESIHKSLPKNNRTSAAVFGHTTKRKKEMVKSLSPSTIDEDKVDDLYFSALYDDDGDVSPISDDRYADSIQFQEVLFSSIIPFNRHLSIKKLATALTKSESVSEIVVSLVRYVGESSGTKMNVFDVCSICVEEKSPDEMFLTNNCAHSFCKDCIGRHIGARLQDNIYNVTCPEVDCRVTLSVDDCREFVPTEVFRRWSDALCESMIIGSERVYCPYKDCSMLLLADDDEAGNNRVTQSVCPGCQRMFCAKCNVEWHVGMKCEEYQDLDENLKGREDFSFIHLAKDKKWKRCPKCKFYVEKKDGCLHMTCRCRFQFCYGCGKTWSDRHASCHT